LAWNESTTIRFKSRSETFRSTADVSENLAAGSAARAMETIEANSSAADATCLNCSAFARMYADVACAGSAIPVTVSNSHA